MVQAAGDGNAQMSAMLARIRSGETIEASEIAGLFALEQDGFGTRTLGLEWDRVHQDATHAHIDIDERHLQPYGIVHGGVWCAVIESLASVSAAIRVAGSGRFVVGVSNATDFLRSHRQGRVDAVATPIHVGRSQQLWQVVLTRASDGAQVARGQVRLANIDPAQVAT